MFYVVMGVSGSGKSTVGKSLALRLGIPFFDGDAFHPIANVEKMSKGIPLNDDDRKIFIKNINAKCIELKSQDSGGVFACSALKEIYRIWLSEGLEDSIEFLYLKGDFETINQRLLARKDHFMPVSLLKSQYDILEEPKNAHSFDIKHTVTEIVTQFIKNSGKSEFGLVGLGVMGKSLARNLADKGFVLSLFNRFVLNKEENIAKKAIVDHKELNLASGFQDLGDFVNSLSKPRKIFLMIQAGEATDKFLEELTPLLDKGDVVIDGGNSHYIDTLIRQNKLGESGIYFLGTGVSGGEKGALTGPAIMPSGHKLAFDLVQPYFEAITATDFLGTNCCTYIGPEGSGHFVKMIHNGIEYAEMQLIAEVYAICRFGLKMPLTEISKLFSDWNKTDSGSYLLEITADILTKKKDNQPTIDLILDKAGNKGTGNWSTVAAAELGYPATMITAALFARYVSVIKTESNNIEFKNTDLLLKLDTLKSAYDYARKVNHVQGFNLMQAASDAYSWNLNLSEIARIMTNGCIIRSVLMENLVGVLKENKLNHQFLENELEKTCLKQVLKFSLDFDIPLPCLSAAYVFAVSVDTTYPTANVIQAQRDYFGAHTFIWKNEPNSSSVHYNWEL